MFERKTILNSKKRTFLISIIPNIFLHLQKKKGAHCITQFMQYYTLYLPIIRNIHIFWKILLYFNLLLFPFCSK